MNSNQDRHLLPLLLLRRLLGGLPIEIRRWTDRRIALRPPSILALGPLAGRFRLGRTSAPTRSGFPLFLRRGGSEVRFGVGNGRKRSTATAATVVPRPGRRSGKRTRSRPGTSPARTFLFLSPLGGHHYGCRWRHGARVDAALIFLQNVQIKGLN